MTTPSDPRTPTQTPNCERCGDTGWRPLTTTALWLPMQAATEAMRLPCECGATPTPRPTR